MQSQSETLCELIRVDKMAGFDGAKENGHVEKKENSGSKANSWVPVNMTTSAY